MPEEESSPQLEHGEATPVPTEVDVAAARAEPVIGGGAGDEALAGVGGDSVVASGSPGETDAGPATMGASTEGKPAATLPDDPLPDGTKPTVLAMGAGRAPHGKVKAGPASLGRLYQRADRLTMLLTFVGLMVAAGLVLGGYYYFTSSRTKPTAQPKLTTLNQAEIQKLGGFFTGNTTGEADQILTVTSSSLFQGRVALSSDLKVVGGAEVSGPTALGDLTVDKTSTLGVTNVRGQLTVAGPTTLQSPAVLAAGASISGNVTASGNGSFGGSLSAGLLNVQTLSVGGVLNLAGHLAVTGQTPTAAPGSDAGGGATASVSGNDSAGTLTITTGAVAAGVTNGGGLLGGLTFRTPYATTPHIVITPVGANSARVASYVLKTASGFTVGSLGGARSTTAYSFDYWVVQ